MRRFAVVVTISVICSSWATAASVDQLSSRLKQYDDQNPVGRLTQPRANSANYPEEVTAGEDVYPGDATWDAPSSGCADGGCGCSGGCSGGCGCNGACFPRRSFYGRAEALAWWVRGSNTPPLVTTSPDNTPAGTAGLLPNATVLFGDQRVDSQGRAGGRFTLGYWFGDCDTFAVEDTFFFLGTANQGFQATSDNYAILARPFFDTATGGQDIQYIAFPGLLVGSVKVTTSSKLLGNELNLRRALYVDSCRRLDILAGYRYLHLGEGLQLDSSSTITNPLPNNPDVVVGTSIAASDSFLTRNTFNGGQLGFASEYYNGRWTLELRTKLAIGNVSQRVTINGNTTITTPNVGSTTFPGGLGALPSNIGQFNRNQFGVLPEFGVNLHYQMNPCWKFTVGYTIFALTNVVRPGDQVDSRIDANQIPGQQPPPAGPFTFPAFAFHNSDILVQGINLGLVHEF